MPNPIQTRKTIVISGIFISTGTLGRIFCSSSSSCSGSGSCSCCGSCSCSCSCRGSCSCSYSPEFKLASKGEELIFREGLSKWEKRHRVSDILMLHCLRPAPCMLQPQNQINPAGNPVNFNSTIMKCEKEIGPVRSRRCATEQYIKHISIKKRGAFPIIIRRVWGVYNTILRLRTIKENY